MSEATATRKDIDEVLDLMRTFMQQVGDEFNKADAKFSNIGNELNGIKQEIADLKESHNRLLNTIDGFVARIDKYETELAARDNQFQKLLIWARKVSEKTGIPLENL